MRNGRRSAPCLISRSYRKIPISQSRLPTFCTSTKHWSGTEDPGCQRPETWLFDLAGERFSRLYRQYFDVWHASTPDPEAIEFGGLPSGTDLQEP